MCITSSITRQFLWTTDQTYQGACFFGKQAMLGTKSVLQFFTPDVEASVLEERAFMACAIVTGLTALHILSTFSPPVIGAMLVIAVVICIYRGEELLEIAKKSLGLLEKVATAVDLSYQTMIENFPLVLEALSEIKKQNHNLQEQLANQARLLSELQASIQAQGQTSKNLWVLSKSMDSKLDGLTPQKEQNARIMDMLSQRTCPQCHYQLYKMQG